MTPAPVFTRVGKQVLANGFHYADAADEAAAAFLTEALQLRVAIERAWSPEHVASLAPMTPAVEAQLA